MSTWEDWARPLPNAGQLVADGILPQEMGDRPAMVVAAWAGQWLECNEWGEVMAVDEARRFNWKAEDLHFSSRSTLEYFAEWLHPLDFTVPGCPWAERPWTDAEQRVADERERADQIAVEAFRRRAAGKLARDAARAAQTGFAWAP